MLLPRIQLAVLVDGALVLVVAGGAEEIMGEIVFARPLQLDRALHLHGDGGRFDHVIVHQPAPEAAARAGLVDHHLVVGHPHQRRHHRQAAIGLLGRRPDFHHPVMPMRRGVHRLHRGVGDEAIFVIGLHRLGGLAEGMIDIADILVRLGGEGVGDLLRPRRKGGGGILGGFAFVPIDLQLVLGLERRPGVLGDDGDAGHHFDRLAGAGDHEGVDHAGQRLDLGHVEGTDLAAHRRAFGEIGIRHAGQPHIAAEQRLAGDDLGIVDAVMAPAQQAILLARLQGQRGRDRAPASSPPHWPANHRWRSCRWPHGSRPNPAP